MRRARPVAIDLFCGAGGMSLGFEQAGFDVVAAVESDPIHAATYQHNFPDAVVIERDVARVRGDRLRTVAGLDGADVDCLFGGPPCQGFSPAGRLEANDPRNELVLHFARLVRELAPRYFVLENVPGLVQAQGQRILNTFERRVTRSGYRLVWPPPVLDASDFGVPQRRRRVFLIGAREDVPQLPAFREGHRSARPTVWDALGDLPDVDALAELLEDDVYHGPLGPPSAYAAVLRGEATDPADHSHRRNGHRTGLTGCCRTLHTPETVARFDQTEPGAHEPISRFYRLPADGVAHTLRAGTGPERGSYTAPRPIHPLHPRCITVREAARLHSFPDWFQFHPTKWHGFRQVGNSVPPRLARAVAGMMGRAASLKGVPKGDGDDA
ncbi:MAG: DNA cytosine methyltransferase [Armatimonadetes bacterium]|nr:DNA cytosine methyltransferase [Armatimonadota bacterium]